MADFRKETHEDIAASVSWQSGKKDKNKYGVATFSTLPEIVGFLLQNIPTKNSALLCNRPSNIENLFVVATP